MIIIVVVDVVAIVVVAIVVVVVVVVVTAIISIVIITIIIIFIVIIVIIVIIIIIPHTSTMDKFLHKHTILRTCASTICDRWHQRSDTTIHRTCIENFACLITFKKKYAVSIWKSVD
jgi:predicted ferric reductase